MDPFTIRSERSGGTFVVMVKWLPCEERIYRLLVRANGFA
jgi:hypothetical protein